MKHDLEAFLRLEWFLENLIFLAKCNLLQQIKDDKSKYPLVLL